MRIAINPYDRKSYSTNLICEKAKTALIEEYNRYLGPDGVAHTYSQKFDDNVEWSVGGEYDNHPFVEKPNFSKVDIGYSDCSGW